MRKATLIVSTNNQTGEVQTASDHGGRTVEVVVTTQTIVYCDVTMQQFNGPPPEGQKIRQVLESGSPDVIVESSGIIVWGKKTGDRVIAEVLVYLSPVFRSKYGDAYGLDSRAE